MNSHRLLTALLLYRSGYVVGKYVSIESKIAKNKDLYYQALEDCQEGWHENREDVKYIEERGILFKTT